MNSVSELEELVICDTVPQKKTNESVKDRLTYDDISKIFFPDSDY